MTLPCLAAPSHARPTPAQPTFGVHLACRRLRGPFTAAGSLLRAIVPQILRNDPDLARRHDLEILTAAPELGAVLLNTRTTLTSRADPATRTRYYPHDRVRWIGNGITDLVLAHAAALGGGQSVAFTGTDDLDDSDAAWLEHLVRRADPAVLAVVLEPAPRGAAELVAATAADYVARACLAAGSPGERAYLALSDAERAALHDDVADRLETAVTAAVTAAAAVTGAADGDAQPLPELGAIPFHREHGSDPARAVEALSNAQQTALMAGFYPAVVDLGHRLRALVSWQADEQACWLATVKMTIAHQAMAEPDPAMELFDDACAGSALPSVHMQSAYGRAMVYTRYYEPERRDLRKAKGLINTAIALAQLAGDTQRRAYNRTFNENGLALVEMHVGDLDAAAALVREGIARLDREVTSGRFLLHRSVLRYNLAQLLVRTAPLEEALAAYDEMVAEDPNHPDYYFDRAGLLARAGRVEEAIADYTAAVTVGPPYPEPYYNRADLLMQLGDVDGALRDFARVAELEPGFVDAYVNRASLLLELGDLAGAGRDVEAGLAAAPGSAHLLALAGMLHEGGGRLDEALAALEQAVAADPGLASAWANLGAVHFARGDAEDAVTALERSLALADDDDVRANLDVARGACTSDQVPGI